MPIRKGKLRKPCAKCGSMFIPFTRSTKLCQKCNGNGPLQRLIALQKKVDKSKRKLTERR